MLTMKKMHGWLFKALCRVLNRLKLSRKFMIVYIFCVFLPLVITDSIIVYSVYEAEVNEYQYDMAYVASLYKNSLFNMLESNRMYINSINMNSRINAFLNEEYASPYEYYDEYYQMINGSFLSSLSGLTTDHICVYADNDTILDGDFFKKMSNCKDTAWYRMYIENNEEEGMYICYDEEQIGNSISQKRKIYYVKKMNYFKNGCEKIVVIQNDPSTFQRKMKELGNRYPMYIRLGNYVVFTNMGDNIVYEEDIPRLGEKSYKTIVSLKGLNLDLILYNDRSVASSVLQDYHVIIITMILFTIVIPLFTLALINKSIITRILKLEQAFGEDEDNVFHHIEDIDGTDEIANLMRKYNSMVDLTNNLVTTVYKDRLKEQENDLARKNAELLALQSQINPHFLFNALESIRMHSLLKGETETSVMVGKLALMQRQNVEWGQDFVTVKKEMESIEAYLYLQNYRFGERLKFELDVTEDCENYLIPKLTVVTFVENACVHGIESKPTQGWIFVRAYKNDAYLSIEVEDTGGGMTEEEVKDMEEKIKNVSLDSIKGKKHVGILNACLRLKMITSNTVEFFIDSEEGIGMSVEIRIPLQTLKTAANA